MGNNPSKHKDNKLPVERVSWNDAVAFCAKLTERECAAKRIPENMKYTLPTEAQWEYACRAGTKTRFCFGNASSELSRYGNFCDKSFQEKNKPGWATDSADKVWNDGYEKAAPVGSFRPNAWGLYDMHGNVWEWCADNFSILLQSGSDPLARGGDSSRAIQKGGAFEYALKYCRSATRGRSKKNAKSVTSGFRVALVEE